MGKLPKTESSGSLSSAAIKKTIEFEPETEKLVASLRFTSKGVYTRIKGDVKELEILRDELAACIKLLKGQE